MSAILAAVVGNLARFTLDKLAELSGVSEMILKLHSLPEIVKEVESLKKDLSTIQAAIKEEDKNYQINEVNKKWVLDLVEIAYEIEDAVDIFLSECPNAFRRFNIVQGVFSKLPFLYKFQNEVINIREKITAIDENRKKYYQTDGKKKKDHENTPQYKLNRELDLKPVGFDKHVENVVKNLCDENRKELAAVSIVGPGGIGKTTLANTVCTRFSEDVSKVWNEIVWVDIPENYVFHDVLKMIATKLSIQSTAMDDKDSLAEQIRKTLTSKRYLIVLDNVWTNEVYENLKQIALPDSKNGSRVLITTRLVEDVARSADTKYEPYKLNSLNDEDSRGLFLKYAIPENQERRQHSIDRLKDLPNEFIKKCQGWPLALKALGKFLCASGPEGCTHYKWQEKLRKLSWQDEKIKCINIIATSFEHLPYEKKFCFMYFAALPADHQEIEARPLLRMWIAEGLIPPMPTKTLEQTAEEYLNDLEQRSMVEVSERYSDGSIKYFRVHPILREIAIQKAKDYNFLVVCTKEDDWEHCSMAHRVAVHYPRFELGASQKIRSLLIFGESELDCSKYRLLRVLADMDMKVELRSFARLPNLIKYLQLNSKGPDKESDFNKRMVWAKPFILKKKKTIKAMNFLETVDIGSAFHGDLTPWIWQIKTLRHVQLPNYPTASTHGPPASANLRKLQTLKGVISSKTWETKLPNMPEVRELDIECDSSPCQMDVIAALLKKLEHLVSLSLSGTDFQIEKFKDVFPTLKTLKYMKIATKKGCALHLKDDMLPPNLIELHLDGFQCNLDDLIPVLKKLEYLKILTIISKNKSYSSNNASRPFEDFEYLEKLTLDGVVMRREGTSGGAGDISKAKWVKEIQETCPAAAAASVAESNLSSAATNPKPELRGKKSKQSRWARTLGNIILRSSPQPQAFGESEYSKLI